jgi:hypothetical protein
MSGTLPFGWSRSSSIAALSFAIMSRTPLSKVVLQNFGFPGHRRQAAQFDAEQKQLKAKQARLERELDATKDKLGKVRVTQSITDYNLREMCKQVDASAGASIEMEFESRSAHFQMKATHPDAAKALKEFATGIINGQADGTLWLPGPAGSA